MLRVRCDVDIFKLTASALSIYRADIVFYDIPLHIPMSLCKFRYQFNRPLLFLHCAGLWFYTFISPFIASFQWRLLNLNLLIAHCASVNESLESRVYFLVLNRGLRHMLATL